MPKNAKSGQRDGIWEFEGGYRGRCELALRLLMVRRSVLADVFAAFQREPKGTRPPPGMMDLAEEVHLLADATLVFAAMAVESFLNHYGVVRLGAEKYQRQFERLSIGRKVAALVAACGLDPLEPQHEIFAICKSLFERRNSLVHPKTKEVAPVASFSPIALPSQEALKAVDEMRAFFRLFAEVDPTAPGVTLA